MWRKFEYIAVTHPLSVFGSFIYFILGGLVLGGSLTSFIIALVLYLISVRVALSPLGETLLRFIYGIRKLETNQEKNYLWPIAQELTMATRKFGKPRNIALCVMDKMDINACALGTRTIAVTKGAMRTFSEEQLKAVLAHEFGHIIHGDTIASTFLLIGSGYFYLFILISKTLIFMIDKIYTYTNDKSAGRFLCALIRGLLKIVVFIVSSPMNMVTALESRKREYEADFFAFHLGYGAELISALYLFERISMGDNSTVKQKLTASHPRTTARIGQLEACIDKP